jgi:hypothetical protein
VALRVEKAFGVEPKFPAAQAGDTLLRMQASHDTHAMRQRAGAIKVKRYEPA